MPPINNMTHGLLITLLVLIPTLSHAIDAPTLSVSSSVVGIKRSHSASSNLHNKQSCFLSPYSKIQPHNKLLLNKRTTIISSLVSPDNNVNEGFNYCYMPPYGMAPRGNSGSIVMNMLVNDYDDRFRKKMNSKRVKDPVIQDFGNMQDWQASKTGLGRMGDDKVGDDYSNEGYNLVQGSGPMLDGEYDLIDRQIQRRGGPRGGGDARQLDRGRPRRRVEGRPPIGVPPPPPIMMGNEEDEMFNNRYGGNFWVNPTDSLDQYPNPVDDEMIMMEEEEEASARGELQRYGERSMGRRRRRGRRGNRRRPDLDDEEWFDTRREVMDDEFDDDMDYDGEYGVPPPTRSRSSFRSGAPPPPRPVKQFYDKLFWFGFDPDVTRPTDRTMFGGTRGKFNAMDLLSDREERQRMRYDDTGGRDVRRRRMRGDMPPPPPPLGMPEYDLDMEFRDEMEMDFEDDARAMERQRRRSRGPRRRRRDSRRRVMDQRAEDYNRILGMGGPMVDIGDDEYLPQQESSRRRRKGFAYKYNDIMEDDGEYIDVDAVQYATESDLDMARGSPSSRRRRSWEEREIMMDRVPPPNAVAWGPNGVLEDSPLDVAAMEAIQDIEMSKRLLERKEEDVEDAKEEVVSLKNDAAVCEDDEEMGEIMRDVTNASRALRLARAERDAVSDRVSELEERNWALLSEFDAISNRTID